MWPRVPRRYASCHGRQQLRAGLCPAAGPHSAEGAWACGHSGGPAAPAWGRGGGHRGHHGPEPHCPGRHP
eukprot:1062030-Alexandrium_andersonii.AAC.1